MVRISLRCCRPAVALAVSSLPACSGGDSAETVLGTVSVVRPTLCIARHAALGFCVGDIATDIPASAISALHVGECVSVTYVETRDADHARLRAVRPASPPPGSTDCPAGD